MGQRRYTRKALPGTCPADQLYAAPMYGTSPAVGWPFLRAAVKASMRSIGKRARRPSAGSMWHQWGQVLYSRKCIIARPDPVVDPDPLVDPVVFD